MAFSSTCLGFERRQTVISNEVSELLNSKFEKYNQPNFIINDPISIPHLFTKKQDIEIMGFWAAMLAWGQRKTIIVKCQELIKLMGGEPHDFVLNHSESDLKPFLNFKHRTFNTTDTLYFLTFFKQYYQNHNSLEEVFVAKLKPDDLNIEPALIHFQSEFFGIEDSPIRTRKHIATPQRGSSCKRLNMFLRWMVRQDKTGVDFGLWKVISPAQLICPCDVHVDRVARKLGLIQRPTTDWKTAVELTETLKMLDPLDPVKYDFALFGLGVEGEM
jgi:uncharacterized protein (TIGR02757 family)